MHDHNLLAALDDLNETLTPREQLALERATRSVIAPDGRPYVDALAEVLPWDRVTWYIPTAANGTNVAESFPMPQGCIVVRIDAYAKGAPSGSAFIATVNATGWGSGEGVSIAAGMGSGFSSLAKEVESGARLTLNVTNAAGATGVTVTISYRPLASGVGYGSHSGGSGGGAEPPVTGYAEISESEIDAGTASEPRSITGRRVQYIIDKARNGLALISSLAAVATSGAYGDLTGRPTLGTAAAQDAGDFATSAQGATADTAVQPGDLGDLATQDQIGIADITATGTPGSGTYLRGDGTWATPAGGGGGDMLASTYDPNGANADAFSMDNMAEGATTKIMTAAERTKLSGIATGAEVNVNADWSATSGDGEILNKPSIYTQAEINARLPEVVLDANVTTLNSAGNFVGATGRVFSGLDPAATYTVSWLTHCIHNGANNGNYRLTARIVGATTTDASSGTYLTQIATDRSTAVNQNRVTGIQPDGSGNITVYPMVQWVSGTVSFRVIGCSSSLK